MRASSPGQARRPLGVAVAGALLVLLVPKCPLCLAAYLSFLGAAAGVVWLRPFGVALALGGLLVAAWLPLLKRSTGAVVNCLSLAALAPLPIIPAYSISKAAAFSMTQSLRAFLAGEGVKVHAVFLGPVDTDMTRDFDIPKASAGSAAAGILDGVENGEDDIFPDPASRAMAEGFRNGVAKALEREFAAFTPPARTAA